MPSTAAAVNDDTHWALSQFKLTSVMDMRFRPRKPATETLLVAFFSSFREQPLISSVVYISPVSPPMADIALYRLLWHIWCDCFSEYIYGTFPSHCCGRNEESWWRVWFALAMMRLSLYHSCITDLPLPIMQFVGLADFRCYDMLPHVPVWDGCLKTNDGVSNSWVVRYFFPWWMADDELQTDKHISE